MKIICDSNFCSAYVEVHFHVLRFFIHLLIENLFFVVHLPSLFLVNMSSEGSGARAPSRKVKVSNPDGSPKTVVVTEAKATKPDKKSRKDSKSKPSATFTREQCERMEVDPPPGHAPSADPTGGHESPCPSSHSVQSGGSEDASASTAPGPSSAQVGSIESIQSQIVASLASMEERLFARLSDSFQERRPAQVLSLIGAPPSSSSSGVFPSGRAPEQEMGHHGSQATSGPLTRPDDPSLGHPFSSQAASATLTRPDVPSLGCSSQAASATLTRPDVPPQGYHLGSQAASATLTRPDVPSLGFSSQATSATLTRPEVPPQGYHLGSQVTSATLTRPDVPPQGHHTSLSAQLSPSRAEDDFADNGGDPSSPDEDGSGFHEPTPQEVRPASSAVSACLELAKQLCPSLVQPVVGEAVPPGREELSSLLGMPSTPKQGPSLRFRSPGLVADVVRQKFSSLKGFAPSEEASGAEAPLKAHQKFPVPSTRKWRGGLAPEGLPTHPLPVSLPEGFRANDTSTRMTTVECLALNLAAAAEVNHNLMRLCTALLLTSHPEAPSQPMFREEAKPEELQQVLRGMLETNNAVIENTATIYGNAILARRSDSLLKGAVSKDARDGLVSAPFDSESLFGRKPVSEVQENQSKEVMNRAMIRMANAPPPRKATVVQPPKRKYTVALGSTPVSSLGQSSAPPPAKKQKSAGRPRNRGSSKKGQQPKQPPQ